MGPTCSGTPWSGQEVKWYWVTLRQFPPSLVCYMCECVILELSKVILHSYIISTNFYIIDFASYLISCFLLEKKSKEDIGYEVRYIVHNYNSYRTWYQ